jgi:hypothetical protein
VQAEPVGKHVAACAGVGATIDVTNGTATTAAIPNVLTICLLVIPAMMDGIWTFSSIKWSFESWSRANQTICSSIGALSSRETAWAICETEERPSQ